MEYNYVTPFTSGAPWVAESEILSLCGEFRSPFRFGFRFFVFFRDFSRFSEDWPGAVVVRFGSVTLSSVVCLETTRVGWAGWGM